MSPNEKITILLLIFSFATNSIEQIFFKGINLNTGNVCRQSVYLLSLFCRFPFLYYNIAGLEIGARVLTSAQLKSTQVELVTHSPYRVMETPTHYQAGTTACVKGPYKVTTNKTPMSNYLASPLASACKSGFRSQYILRSFFSPSPKRKAAHRTFLYAWGFHDIAVNFPLISFLPRQTPRVTRIKRRGLFSLRNMRQLLLVNTPG